MGAIEGVELSSLEVEVMAKPVSPDTPKGAQPPPQPTDSPAPPSILDSIDEIKVIS